MTVIVVFESTRGRTKAMAEAICEGVKSKSVDCKLTSASQFDGLDGACAFAIGSSTRMKKPLPLVRRILAELDDLNGLPSASFGSYGWSGEAPAIITSLLEEKGATIVSKPIRAKDFPTEEMLEKCRGLGSLLADRCNQ